MTEVPSEILTDRVPQIAADSRFSRLVSLDPDLVGSPFAAYADLRANAPVAWSDRLEAYVVTRYADILEVLKDPMTFSSKMASGPGSVTSLAHRVLDGQEFPEDVRAVARRRIQLSKSPVLLFTDPPLHKRQRLLIARGFTPRRVKGMEQELRRIANGLIDAFVGKGEVELISEFAVPLPMTVIATLLGVPPEKRDDFKRWSDAFTRGVGALDLSTDEVIEVFRATGEFYDYFSEELVARRAAPGDDIISTLVEARVEGEKSLSDDECLQMLVQFLTAGNETTTNLIGSIVLHLLRDPALLEEIKANTDLIPTLIEECLRLEAPTQGMWRVATSDTEIAGNRIRQGSLIYLIYASGNRDAAEFDNPDKLDLYSHREHHLAFGRGEHVCVGANLVRVETAIAVQALISRLPGMALATDIKDLEYLPSFQLRGLKTLPLTFSTQ